MPRLLWIAVIGAFLFSLSLAGQGRKLLGERVPDWMLPHTNRHYEGYGESLKRLPNGTNAAAIALFSQGQTMEAQNNFDEAIGSYGQALVEDPDFVKCMTAKGILHCMKGEIQEGQRLFQEAAKRAPRSAFVFHLLARAEKQMGLLQESEAHERRARENLVNERARESLSQ
jgi:tetratricopeptide (TPR) repeat protein